MHDADDARQLQFLEPVPHTGAPGFCGEPLPPKLLAQDKVYLNLIITKAAPPGQLIG
jgi:hypothetical protein